jgi:hypothetical protein
VRRLLREVRGPRPLPGSWDHVTVGFMDTLPRDPGQLYDTLRDFERRAHGDDETSYRMLSHAAELLRTGLGAVTFP